MLKTFLIIIAILITAGCKTKDKPDEISSGQVEEFSLKGKTYPPLPGGLKKLSGALALEAGEDPLNARFSFLHAENDSAGFLILSEFVRREAGGSVIWKINDYITLPEMKEKQRLQVSECTYGENGAAAAIVPYTSSEKINNVIAAWGVDREKGELIELNPDSVNCRNAGLVE